MFFADTGVPMPSVQLELLVSFIGSIFTSAWKDRMSQFFVKAYVSILLAQQPHWTWLDRHLFVSRLSHKKCVRSRWKFRWIVIFSPTMWIFVTHTSFNQNQYRKRVLFRSTLRRCSDANSGQQPCFWMFSLHPCVCVLGLHS